jgi:hypothetical protein
MHFAKVDSSTSGDDSGDDSFSDDCSGHSSDQQENQHHKSSDAQQFEDVEELFGELGFDKDTQLWPQEPRKPFGNF